MTTEPKPDPVGTEIAPATPTVTASNAVASSPARESEVAKSTAPSAPKALRSQRPHDETCREAAAEQLTIMIGAISDMVDHCQNLLEARSIDGVPAINATARLINAQAQVARALAQVAPPERRSRSIVERIQRPDPENAGLNAIFSGREISSPQQRKKMRDLLERALLQFLDEQKRDREKQEGSAIETSA